MGIYCPTCSALVIGTMETKMLKKNEKKNLNNYLVRNQMLF